MHVCRCGASFDLDQIGVYNSALVAWGMTLSALLAKYDRKVPRYTSYPTAPHFSAAVDGGVYADWLAALPGQDAVSVYLHVPFCEALCLYCGCNTAVVRRDGPLRLYAAHLMREIGLVRQAVGARLPVREIHFGGGTPTALPADRLTGIMDALRDAFAVAEDAAISVELDPRHLPKDRLQALAAMGITRASLGVQDLDPTVQRAVRRLQPVEMVQDCMARLRGIGVDSINLDLIYGLPHQTENGVVRTA